ncbi:MAG: polysaccharide lyase [Prevotellaceae bacterium]|jgi:hypothetical protein|nr:polysaccharide lyase [Prevotellaceae bacterium]
MKKIILLGAAVLAISASMAQYPKVSDEERAALEGQLREGEEYAQKMWEKALPIIQKEAREGRPYIPFASRPTDLPQADIPAFPGAEGGGMYTFGGRGGKILTVTNLNDSGEGSLRWACLQGGARIIVFNVAGIIKLESPIRIKAPYVTIAGQTAPGDGVCIAGESFEICTHDVIVRHLRVRRGETNPARREDAVGGNPIGNIMIDHVSASWGLDENISSYRHMYNPEDGSIHKKFGTSNLTIQNSISSQALDSYNHAFGSTLGGENASFMRNLWANNTGRNPSIGWNGIFNFVNNVIFNWVHRSVDGGDYTALYNMINNYYKPGPMTPKSSPVGHRILKPESGRSKLPYKVYGRVYASGNIMEGNEKVTNNNWDGGIQIENQPNVGKHIEYMKWDKPHPMPYMTTMPTKEAYEFVLNNAGANIPKRDIVDERTIHQIRTGEVYYVPDFVSKVTSQNRRLPADSYKYGIITDIGQVGGYPEYKGKPYKDSDGDGIPDEWEIKYGLNPNDPSDANGDLSGDGYTNIEKYINGIDPAKKVDWKDLKNNYDTLAEKGKLM